MATMVTKKLQSSTLRRLIGVVKATLIRHTTSLTQLVADYGYTLDKSDYAFQALSAEEVLQFHAELISSHSSILKSYSKLESMHIEWQKLRDSSPDEEAVFQSYIERLGNYTDLFSSTVSTLEKLDVILHSLETEAESRDIPLPQERQTPGSPGEEHSQLQALQSTSSPTGAAQSEMSKPNALPLLGNPFPPSVHNPVVFSEPQLIHRGTHSLPVSTLASLPAPNTANVTIPSMMNNMTRNQYGFGTKSSGFRSVPNFPYYGGYNGHFEPNGPAEWTNRAFGFNGPHGQTDWTNRANGFSGTNGQTGPMEWINRPSTIIGSHGPNGPTTLQPGIPMGTMPGSYFAPEQTFNFVDASLLTKLELPSFDGNILEFPEFWTSFMTLVGSKPQLDGATKLTLLKSSLKGRALSTLEGLPLTSENYLIAVEILRTHFDNPATLRHTIYTKLAALPNCDENGRQLPSLYCKMLSLVRQYSCCSDDSSEYGLSALLQNKLPKFVRSRIYDRNPSNKNLTPIELLQILTDIVRKEQSLLNPLQPNTTADVFHVQVAHQDNKTKKQRESDENGDMKKKGKKGKCHLCESSDHKAHKCTTYPTAAEKVDAVKKKGLCCLCFRTNHAVQECTCLFRCDNCKGKHSTALCLKSSKQSADQCKTTPDRNKRQSQGASAQKNRGLFSNNKKRNQQTVHFTSEELPGMDEEDFAPVNNMITDNVSFVYTVTDNQKTAVQQELSLDICDSKEVEERDSSLGCESEPNLLNPNKEEVAPTALMCVDVMLFNPEKPEIRVKTRAFFDSGATKSYITNELANQLHLRTIQEEPLSVNTFGRDDSTTVMSCLHSLGLETTDGSEPVITTIKAVPKLTSSLQMVLAQCEKLGADSTKISTTTVWDKPQLLIGIDLFWNLILSEEFHFHSLPTGHRLLHTRLGYVIANKQLGMEYCFQTTDKEVSLANPLKHMELEQLVERFWHIETLGIMDDPTKSDDDKCLDLFHKSIEFDKQEGRYKVSLPFKISPNEIPTNRALAFSRTVSNWKYLSRNSEYLIKYHAIFEDQIQKGIIEPVPESDLSKTACHYLAHFGVVSENKKTTKIRAVFDGSAKTKGELSINEALFRGPVLLPNLAGILLRCRLAKILLSGDLEKAFLMVSLNEDSRDYTRFYWLKDPLQKPTGSNLVEFRFCRVPFGLVPSPFLLEATIHFHLVQTGTPLATALLQNIYVDNVFLDVDSVEHGKQLYKESKELFQQAGMNLREFMTSDPDLNTFVEEQENTKVDQHTKILGIHWNTSSDVIKIELPLTPLCKTWTKRKILKETASIYDPLGWVVPATLPLKVFLQSLWKINLGWDEALPADKQMEWNILMKNRVIKVLEMPRRFLDNPDGTERYSIHVFCDASATAYGCVGYLCIENLKGKSTHLLMAKSRLTPVSGNITIPRLELQGLVIGAKLLTYLRTELKLQLEEEYLWSDSRAALMWIKAGKDLPIFVRNRVKTINDACPMSIIRHVPGQLNPADIASRGTTIEELMNDRQWWNGPSFLCGSVDSYPEDKSAVELQENETDKFEEPSVAVYATTGVCITEFPVNVFRFSTWIKLVNVVALIFTFLANATKKCAMGARIQAINRLYLEAQEQYPPTDDQIMQLRLFRKPGTQLWRCQSRIDNSDLPEFVRNPISWPRESQITKLLILDHHFTNEHAGVNQTLSDLRQLFWIPKGRITVQKVIQNDCYCCKRRLAKPYCLPSFPPLPAERVQRPTYPFDSCGLDYIGPYFYRNQEDSTSRKYWIALFTCLSTRAAYVSVVTSLSAATFLHALGRFIALNGCPKFVYSDNAPCFKAVATRYNSMDVQPADEKDLLDYCSRYQIKFKFIPSHSPWQGGCYERIIAIFKTAFNSCIKNSILTMEQVETLVMESLAITNARPLTCYISKDMDCVPLRPIDFIRPNARIGAPRFTEDHEDSEWIIQESSQTELSHLWSRMNRILDTFWNRYYREYLTDLMSRYKNDHPQVRSRTTETPKIGDFVLIKNETQPRGNWKMGQITGSQDNFLRSVEIRTASKNTISRPLNLVCKFEISNSPKLDLPCEHTNDNNVQRTKFTQPISTHPMTTRHKAKLMTTIMMVLCFIGTTDAIVQCDNQNVPHRIIHVDSCMNSGSVIALTQSNTFCWQQMTCPIGALQIPTANGKFCGKPCKCSEWTELCSFYQGPLTVISTYKNVNLDHFLYLPPQVCSFEPSVLCDERKHIAPFNQLELFDGSLLVVKELHVNVKTYGSKDDHQCFDNNGNRVEHPESYQGTEEFCNVRTCTKDSNVFCTFYNSIALYSNPGGNFSDLPVKAWGQALRTYYPHKIDKNEGTNSNPEFKLLCSTGGITIGLPSEETSFIEACLSSVCITITTNQQTNGLIFPTSLVTFEYMVIVKVWRKGRLTFHKELLCTGRPICEILNCFICWQYVYNSRCWKLQHLFGLFAILALSTMVMKLFTRILQIIKMLCKCVLAVIKYCCYWTTLRLFKKLATPTVQQHSNLPRYVRKRPIRKTLATTLMILLSVISVVSCCSDVISSTSQQKQCVSNNVSEECTFQENTILTLAPLNQDLCFKLSNLKDKPMGFISLRVKGVYYRCHKRIEFFTRNHELLSESSHRCSGKGSCENGCPKLKYSDEIPELSHIANRSPGYSFCTASCGCLTCEGCGWCDPSCILYRYYAVPTTPDIYTVFNCPTWELHVEGELSVSTDDTETRTPFTVRPAATFVYNNIKLSLLSATTPNFPILSSTFITDGTRTSTIKPASSGQYISRTPSQLQCPTMEAAQKFLCDFSQEVCVCSHVKYNIQCTCPIGNVSQFLDQNTLPVQTQEILLYTDKELMAKTLYGTAIQAQMVITNMKLTNKMIMNECTSEVGTLNGCYSCKEGAKVAIVCKSTNSEELANLSCGDNNQLLKCTTKGHLNNITFHFDTSTVLQNCSLLCSGGTSTTMLEGHLDFMNDGLPMQMETKVGAERIPNEEGSASGILEKITNLLSFDFSTIAIAKWGIYFLLITGILIVFAKFYFLFQIKFIKKFL